jgi:hypothetical protein
LKFDKILGDATRYKEEINECAKRLGIIFAECSVRYDDKQYCSKIGGDIVIHQLVYIQPHIADVRGMEIEDTQSKYQKLVESKEMSEEDAAKVVNSVQKSLGSHILYTAATNGKSFFWNPRFLNKKSNVGMRLVVNHEAWHGLYMHPSRRGSRSPKLWNIAVDYKVNYTIMNDLQLRGFSNFESMFKKELGDYATLEEYAQFLRDPFNPPAKMANWNPIHSLKKSLDPAYENPKGVESLFFADPKLDEELKRPENIYDYLVNQIPKCKDCRRQPAYNIPDEYKELKKAVNEKKKKDAGK